ncbi:MAG: 4Fe-4S dicluster domain-containing protein [Cyclobacteriaceae bacterium]
MTMIQQLLFLLTLITAGWLIRKRVLFIKKNIELGKKTDLPPNAERWKNLFLIAFGQKKMFTRPIPALLHLLIYVGFVIINIEVLEFILDGLSGTHRLFAPLLGAFYPILMNVFEWLALGVLVSCIFFLIRRNILPIERFRSPELTRWPRLDANIILIAEIILMLAVFTMNAADQVLQIRQPAHFPATGRLHLSSLIIPGFESFETNTLILVERGAWWFHIIGILAFAVYVTYSKHLHIFLAFPNTWMARPEPKGQVTNMPVVTAEVKSMLGLAPAPTATEAARFGARDVTDLDRRLLLSAYSCTECGRCTSECPANLTGKKLSPRKIMMDVRDRMEDLGNGKNAEGKYLLGDYITKEEINACTSCNACVEACPVLINPLDVIIELRRYVSMEESGAPASWNGMYQNIETNFAPWKFSPSDRFNWKSEAEQNQSTAS